jgi:hypothetical protein
MSRANIIKQRLVSKLRANGIIPKGVLVDLKQKSRGSAQWEAIHPVTGESYGAWSDIRMTELAEPGELVKDEGGRVTMRRPGSPG